MQSKPDVGPKVSEETLLKQISVADLSDLMAIWTSRVTGQWNDLPEVYRQLTRRILGHGEPLLAYDVVAEALRVWPGDVELRQLQGLALLRSGATRRGNAVLQELRHGGIRDEETLGMLGRSYKDLALRAQPSDRDELLKRAADTYADAYESSGGYWTGINAATMNLLLGEEDRARDIAEKVRRQCLAELTDRSGDSYWETAALGEAALICRDWPEAEHWYARAAALAQERFGDLQSSRRNARLVLNYWRRPLPQIERLLDVPRVIVFAGHMIDRPDRTTPRFPPNQEEAVARHIRDTIKDIKPGFGFSSAACGSDILFLEAMLEYGAEVSIVLPYDAEDFMIDSVDIIPGSNWKDRFYNVIKNAARVVIASTDERLEIGEVSYDFCNQMLLGLATIRSRQLQTELVPLAVWDGQPGDGPAGASAVVQSWQSLGLKPSVIPLAAGNREQPERRRPVPTTTGAFNSRIVAILFADAAGFSRLREAEVPRFVEHYLGAIAKLTEPFRKEILTSNTWGDGLYFVFSDVASAGDFGLQLARLVRETDWKDKGLATGLNVRIGLHAGPVYEFNDPITGQRTYGGKHVSRAARIEPITPPGQVYASEPFAALAAAHGAAKFTCDYVGETPMAKQYGKLPTYHVRAL